MKTNLLNISFLSALLISGLSAEARRGSTSNRIRSQLQRTEQREAAERLPLTTPSVREGATQISREDANTIAESLVRKANIANQKNTIRDAIVNNSTVGESLKKLFEKLNEDSNNTIRSEDVKTILEFTVNVKNIDSPPVSEINPHSANVVLGLAKNTYDMVSWPVSSRESALDLLSKINNNLSSQYGLSDALNLALKARGHSSSAEKVKRKREIRNNCFK